MQRICVSMLLLSALSGPAFAQIIYVPYAPNQPAYGSPPAASSMAVQRNGQQYYAYMAPQTAAQNYTMAAPATYTIAAAPGYATAAQPTYTGAVQPAYASAAQPAYAAQPTVQPAYTGAVQPAYVSAAQPVYTGALQPAYASAAQPTAQPAYTGAVQPAYARAVQQPIYASTAQPAYTGAVQPAYADVAQPAYGRAAPQTRAAPAPAAPGAVAASSNSGNRGFLEAIFGGPTIEVRRDYLPFPQYPSMRAAPQPAAIAPMPAYAPSSQGDMAHYQVDPKYDRQVVAYRGEERPGTIIIDTPNKFLYLVEDGSKALRYGIGVGRPGFTWAGVKTITAKREWPEWRPPTDMLERRPDLPRYMPGGIDNPLGARALYLGSSLYRIHGSNEPWTIGTNVSSGCIRMRNEDVTDLYGRVKIGTKVVVI